MIFKLRALLNIALFLVIFDIFLTLTKVESLSSIKIISLFSIAASLPIFPIDTPISDLTKLTVSFIPSPTKQTFLLSFFNSSIILALSVGNRFAL